MNGGWGISYEIALRWMPLDLTHDKSTLVQVMAWCRQATSHYLNQCWPRSMSPNGVTRPQWVNKGSVQITWRERLPADWISYFQFSIHNNPVRVNVTYQFSRRCRSFPALSHRSWCPWEPGPVPVCSGLSRTGTQYALHGAIWLGVHFPGLARVPADGDKLWHL